MTSIIMRGLGAKVGRRVYWPGTGPSVQDFDLIDIGDDVVFGSRSHLITTDGVVSAPIVVGRTSMIADRVVLAPGVTVGDRTVMGSGATTSRGKSYPSETIWLGNRGGDAVSVQSRGKKADDHSDDRSDDDTGLLRHERRSLLHQASPFGKAFYQKQANYYVFSMGFIGFYCFFWSIFVAFYWNVPTTVGIQFTWLMAQKTYMMDNHWWRPLSLYSFFTVSISVVMTIQSIFAVLLVIAA